MSFWGSCQCGKLAYEVDEGLPAKAMARDCSMCRRKGTLHHFTTPDKFKRAEGLDLKTLEVTMYDGAGA